jgi:phosphoserine phosphatase RsbU/P
LTDTSAILNLIPSGCISFNNEGFITFVNTPLCDLLQYQSEELINQPIEKIFTISGQLFFQTQLYPLIRLKEKVEEVSIWLKSKAGQRIPTKLYCNRSFINNVETNLCIIVTIWEQRKFETQIANAEKEQIQTIQENITLKKLKDNLELHEQQLDRQISILIERNKEYVQINKVLSHDLQEPIRKISMFAGLLKESEGIENFPNIVSHFGKIQKLVLRLQILTKSLQQFVDLYSSEEPIKLMDVNEVIKISKKKAIIATGAEDFILEVNEIESFEGRQSQIDILFTEIFKNAIQNKSPDNQLVIKIESVIIEENIYQANKKKYHYEDHIKLRISDNSLGFDNKYNDYVFGLFNKLETKSDRIGLGLAIVKQIISYHFGTISINSEVGKGCNFLITLPILQHQ